MSSPWWLVLFLALVPDPGFSQFGVQNKRCRDCKSPITEDDPAMFQKAIDRGANKYIKCPHSSLFRFELNNNEIICADRSLSWVKQLTECLDGDRKCLDSASSGSRKDDSKGINEKPSITTAPVTSVKPTTQSLKQSKEPTKAGAPTPAASREVPGDLDTTPLDSNQANVNLRQGNDKSTERSNVEDSDGKMKHMRTAVISLIAIVLVMVAVGVGLYCRKKKTNKFNTPCGSRSMEYMAASSQDPIIEVKVEKHNTSEALTS